MPGFRNQDKNNGFVSFFSKSCYVIGCWQLYFYAFAAVKKVNPVLVMLKLSLPVLGVIFPVFL
jgi:hypothetical protein